ncbi:hypothetical protein GCM10014719_02910 [Planomonospora parontospora subsp. antibiotica]|nr:hypothetical protein GCM10014719_02910 [Planomonospora parontospora subsp. antibiotica]GII13450.1 hypothetical protein Ppa05_01760 [Planomonospora parontospora subsp. antibiotica]
MEIPGRDRPRLTSEPAGPLPCGPGRVRAVAAAPRRAGAAVRTRSETAAFAAERAGPRPREGAGPGAVEDGYFFGGTGLPPGRNCGGGKRSLRICSARIAA